MSTSDHAGHFVMVDQPAHVVELILEVARDTTLQRPQRTMQGARQISQTWIAAGSGLDRKLADLLRRVAGALVRSSDRQPPLLASPSWFFFCSCS